MIEHAIHVHCIAYGLSMVQQTAIYEKNEDNVPLRCVELFITEYLYRQYTLMLVSCKHD